ncbi:hypothetical protein GX48_00621, partial [Paracoccidioides brasiliensis]
MLCCWAGLLDTPHIQRLKPIYSNYTNLRPAHSRLARRGGVIRMQKDVYDTIRAVLIIRLKEIIRRVVILLDGTKYPGKKRKTVNTQD